VFDLYTSIHVFYLLFSTNLKEEPQKGIYSEFAIIDYPEFKKMTKDGAKRRNK
jgi:hypothetical protein